MKLLFLVKSIEGSRLKAMALAKLWNAVFGKRAEETTAPVVTAGTTPVVGSNVSGTTKTAPAHGTAKSATNGPTIKLSRKKTKSQTAKPSKTAEPVVSPEPAPVLRMFRRKNNAWTKLIGNKTIRSILDLRVGDGSRAVELLEAIVDSNTPTPKYVAIGLFELGSEPLTVRHFHQKIRAAGAHPVAIPMPIAEGLKHLSETIGVVDLVLLDSDQERWKDPKLARLLNRISPPGTLVLRADSAGRWHANSSQSKKAA
jgi:hypothetical protein